jgi:phosphatidylinositol-3-phosphatase
MSTFRRSPVPAVMLCVSLAVPACATDEQDPSAAAPDLASPASLATTTSVIKYVFVVSMENHDGAQIYGNTVNAPYINNTLIPAYARATNFNDELPSLVSEPHYLWMEAGTNAFSDRTFTGDGNPTATNSTASTAHLVTQIRNATNGVTWRTYQEGLNSTTGACPISGSGFYAPKHDPFVFFRDVSGSPPSKTNAYCVAHHRAYSALAADLAAGDVANYTFITPNQCHDMHGQTGCADSNTIRAGDAWLRTELPRLIAFANANSGVIFVTWDEGDLTNLMPFVAIGPGVRAGFAGAAFYNHSSLLKSVEEILNLPILPTVSAASNLSGLFNVGSYP